MTTEIRKKRTDICVMQSLLKEMKDEITLVNIQNYSSVDQTA